MNWEMGFVFGVIVIVLGCIFAINKHHDDRLVTLEAQMYMVISESRGK